MPLAHSKSSAVISFPAKDTQSGGLQRKGGPSQYGAHSRGARWPHEPLHGSCQSAYSLGPKNVALEEVRQSGSDPVLSPVGKMGQEWVPATWPAPC